MYQVAARRRCILEHRRPSVFCWRMVEEALMEVTVTIPEDIDRALALTDVPLQRVALEGLAAEAYRSGTLTESQLMRLLDFPSRSAVHQWLRDREIPYRYTEADLEQDLANLSKLGLR